MRVLPPSPVSWKKQAVNRDTEGRKREREHR
jgi:hypothetical protein